MSQIVRNPHAVVTAVCLAAFVFVIGYVAGESNERNRVAKSTATTVAVNASAK